MEIRELHHWPCAPAEAIQLQRRLAPGVRLSPLREMVRWLAGIDVAFSRDGAEVIAGVVVWERRSGEVIETQVARAPCRFPYVPGLLSFREVPAVLAALRLLRREPDVFLCDGQGYAHPRRFGLACHLGLWLGRPTIGCAKSRLCGEHREPGPRRGSFRRLVHQGETVGCVLRTRDGVKPLYVSPGHLCDLAAAKRVTLLAATGYRLPEPARLAHQLVTGCRGE